MGLRQTAQGNGGGYVQNDTYTFGSNVVVGNTIIVVIAKGLVGAWASVTDNLGNTYTLVAGGGVDQDFAEYKAPVTVGGACTVTVDGAPDYQDIAGICTERDGLTSSPFDVSAATAETGYTLTHPSGNTPTLAQANNLVIGAYGAEANETYTLGSGFSNLIQQNGFDLYRSVAMQDKEVSSTSAVSSDITTSNYRRGYSIVAVYKKAAPPANSTNFFQFIS